MDFLKELNMFTLLHIETEPELHTRLKYWLPSPDIRLIHAFSIADALDKVTLFKMQLIISDYFIGDTTLENLMVKLILMHRLSPTIALTETPLQPDEVTSLESLGISGLVQWNQPELLILTINNVLGSQLTLPDACCDNEKGRGNPLPCPENA